jgi:protein gp37
MAEVSKIEWTDSTWNFLRGCSRVSAGCERCYAERHALRFSGPGLSHAGLVQIGKKGPRWAGEVRAVPTHYRTPMSWRAGRRIFVNSLSDTFHEDAPREALWQGFATMAATPRHTYQVLTKRPAIAAALFHDPEFVGEVRRHLPANEAWPGWPLPNVWIGTSVESGSVADRIASLTDTPAAVRFVSVEPLIGPLPRVDFEGVDWVIVGGESGPGARPMELAWATDAVRRACRDGAQVFVKQLGSVWAKEHGAQHPKGGDPEEWPAHLRVRGFPAAREARR